MKLDFAVALPLFPLLFILSACGSSGPDCGSSSTKSTVIDIAKGTVLEQKLLQAFDFSSDPEFDRLNKIFNSPSVSSEEWNSRATALGNKTAELQNRVKETAQYDVREIVTSEVDPNTKNVTCKAVLYLTSPDFGSTKISFGYTVEATSDGNSKVTLYAQ